MRLAFAVAGACGLVVAWVTFGPAWQEVANAGGAVPTYMTEVPPPLATIVSFGVGFVLLLVAACSRRRTRGALPPA